jgi:hypothetical protein
MRELKWDEIEYGGLPAYRTKHDGTHYDIMPLNTAWGSHAGEYYLIRNGKQCWNLISALWEDCKANASNDVHEIQPYVLTTVQDGMHLLERILFGGAKKSSCPECGGSGKYIGLNVIEPCKACC